ncbi:MAG: hypothetical protein JWM99_3868 [Verrucomicrobiales bacterium]|nr:hypothetical protein [Verrucomicrobiales bacterium]
MVSFPLIARELRIQSRKRATYYSRVGWSLVAIALLGFYWWSFPDRRTNGQQMLSAIHGFLAFMLLILAPIGAAGALNRENREGTLGLLLLTDLSPAQIVLGKVFVHSCKLLYLAAMMLPFFMIPVLLGGVEIQDFLLSLAILFSIVIIGVSTGMVASATIVEFGPALAWALVFELLLAWLLESIVANILIAHLPKNRFDVPLSIRIFLLGPSIIILPLTAKDAFGTLLVSRSLFLWFELGFSLVSILILVGATRFCARKVERHAHFAIESKRQVAFRKKFLTPRFWRGSFRRSMSQKLDRNPLLWLEYRTAWARSARWIMLLIVLLAETFLLRVMPYRDGFLQFHLLFVILFVTFLALKSSSSFQREKESGAFELLLVTPLTETKLLTARLRAVARYYGMIVVTLAAFCLVGISWAQTEYETRRNPSFEVCFASICASIFSVPVCGFYFALRCRAFALALFSTIGVAILAPLVLWNTAQGLVWIQRTGGHNLVAEVMANLIPGLGWPSFLAIAVYHLATIAFCARAATALLRKREFVFY